jgi:hypothetical protein
MKVDDCEMQKLRDKNLYIFGRAALPRRPRIQGRAAALPYRESEGFCRAPTTKLEPAIS